MWKQSTRLRTSTYDKTSALKSTLRVIGVQTSAPCTTCIIKTMHIKILPIYNLSKDIFTDFTRKGIIFF